MKKLGYLAAACLAYGACLYDVGDVTSGSGTGGLGGGNEAGDVSSEIWASGGAGGDLPDVVDASSDAKDAASDAADAPSDAVLDGASGAWSSCKLLGYSATCFGNNTVLYFDDLTCGTTSHCWVNDCSLKSGQCKSFSGGACSGWGCTNKLDSAQAEDCTNWGLGQCRDNAAIKADPTDGKNCLYKDCTALGLTCSKPAGGADCF